MADSNVLGPSPAAGDYGKSSAVTEPNNGLPPSKPLQVFLFFAFVLTALAYLASLRSQSINQEAMQGTLSKIRHLMLNQDNYQSHSKYGFEAMDRKHYDLAAFHFRAALTRANTAEGHYNLGAALLKQTNFDGAFAEFQAALHLNPNFTAVYKAWDRALMNDQDSHFLDIVARSYAADGDFSQAMIWENKAILRARALNQQDLLKEFETRNVLYQQQKAQ